MLFGMMLALVVAAFVSERILYLMTAVLTFISVASSIIYVTSCAFGWRSMRRDSKKDWDASLQRYEEETCEALDYMHIVILPNYKEEEQMLLHTLKNIARSVLAKDRIRVVLAMEAREGQKGIDKAKRLIEQTKHLFKDVIASYHPEGVPAEVPGKSSNSQWAYRQALRHYASDLSKLDASRVFLTIGDADTLWHPQFFSAMTYQALMLPVHERVWTIFQPPVLLLRNLFSVPRTTRVTGYGTIIFEVGGLMNQWSASHLCYSAYSLTLALASHPLVGGWDTDVIAEDHHMFCKCFFASIWEAVETPSEELAVAGVPAHSKVVLKPVFLPAISYLVESDKGWAASAYARFQQARRHSQGVAELSYVMLQYIQLLLRVGVFKLPVRTHFKILSIARKMATVHIINMLQALGVMGTSVVLGIKAVGWVSAGGVSALLGTVVSQGPAAAVGVHSFGGVVLWSLVAVFGPLPPVGMLLSIVTYAIIQDLLEGRFTETPWRSEKRGATGLAAPDAQGSAPEGKHGFGSARLSWWRKLKLFTMIQYDLLTMAETTLVVYGLVPVVLAAWSLMRNGTKFEYIVAAKPGGE